MVAELKKLAASAAGKHAAYKKYTVQPTGIWKRIGDFFAVDPKRSSGIPLNPQYRLPSPGAVDPKLYDDPTTVPAADLAENPYWKRDVRRSYPKLSVVKQPDVVALLTVGSAQNPKEHVLQIGDAGAKQLVSVKEEGQKGLSAFFQKENKAGVSVLGPNGLPPFPTSRYPSSTPKRYEMLKEQAYSAKYALQPPLTRATDSLTLPTATLAGCSSRFNEHVHFLFLRRSKFDMA
ncbi:NADH dehydrogenase 29/21K chain [Aureobasidium pullulans]|nr:NADH dehydrogenase 29/21K chain [Aureobasidium pullulans]